MPSKIRTITSGPLEAGLEQLGPFFFVAEQGTRGLYTQQARIKPGQFLIAEAVENGLIPYCGLILPLSRCADQRVTTDLLALRQFIRPDAADNGHAGRQHPDRHVTATRAAAQRHLSAAFGDALFLHERNPFRGFAQFRRSPGLFPFLSSRFEYVTAFTEESGGKTTPASYAPFAWDAYGAFLQWFHELDEEDNWGWRHTDVFLVFDSMELFHYDFSAARRLKRPAFDPSRLFTLAPQIKVAKLDFNMTQEDYVGVATLSIRRGESVVDIGLFDTSPPFEMLLEWLKMIARGDLPVRVEIDAEGRDKRLEAYSAGDLDRMLVRIQEPYDCECEVFLECLVDRQQFAEDLRTALRDFFVHKFRPDHWDAVDWDGDTLRSRMLSDPWLMRGARQSRRTQ